MFFNISIVMVYLPIIGAAVTFVVFLLLMHACIRMIDKEAENAARDEWWNDEQEIARTRGVAKPHS